MNVTLAEALGVVSLETVKQELRIPPFSVPEDPVAAAAAAATQKSHDDFLSGQILAAVQYVKETTGVALADLPQVRPAIIASVRSQYDGNREITKDAAHHAWLQPYRSYAQPE